MGTGILIVIIFLLIIRHCIYRRQVKNICRRLEYIKENDTNMLLTVDVSSKELVELVSGINENNVSYRNKINDYKKKDEMLKEAITNLSHDIRTPLTSLNGYFQMLESDVNQEVSKKYMDIIQGRINILKDLLEELFTYTKLQNDSYELEFQSENMHEIVNEAVVSFYREFKNKGIVPEIDFSDSEMTGMCSKMALSRIIHNIIKNAVLHGDKSIKMSLKSDNGHMVFECRNKVVNPDKIDTDNVFERFYKADEARRNTSTGLGLAIAKELTLKMSGEINAQIENDEFIIILKIPVML
ncbi:MAG: HAMP domain-containing histidine kinase [Lachnospiraceae bacterium]|nr:HAMP domain-containing histidine kinase [Lachnospiraceae bacterium]